MSPAVVNGKWSLLAKILIGLGATSSLLGVVSVAFGGNPVEAIINLIGLAVYWNLYHLKPRSLFAFNLFIALIMGVKLLILATIAIPLGSQALVVLLPAVGIMACVLFYFNSASVRAALQPRSTS